MNEALKAAIDFAARRAKLEDYPPVCYRCGSEQVQLTWWTGAPPAEWRCRDCDAEFMFEAMNV